MTVPEGTPKNIEWADRMRQALVGAGADLEALKNTFMANDIFSANVTAMFEDAQKSLRNLDEIADELAAFDMPLHGCSEPDHDHSQPAASPWEGLCRNCGHEAHGFDVKEFSVICGVKLCQCRGM